MALTARNLNFFQLQFLCFMFFSIKTFLKTFPKKSVPAGNKKKINVCDGFSTRKWENMY